MLPRVALIQPAGPVCVASGGAGATVKSHSHQLPISRQAQPSTRTVAKRFVRRHPTASQRHHSRRTRPRQAARSRERCPSRSRHLDSGSRSPQRQTRPQPSSIVVEGEDRRPRPGSTSSAPRPKTNPRPSADPLGSRAEQQVRRELRPQSRSTEPHQSALGERDPVTRCRLTNRERPLTGHQATAEASTGASATWLVSRRPRRARRVVRRGLGRGRR